MKSDRLILIVAVYAAAWFIFVRLPGDIVRSPIAGTDLSSYYTAGYLVRTGQAPHLYDVGPGDTILGDATGGPYRQAGDALGIARQHYYIYPPFFALAAAPLSFASFSTARAAWLGMDLLLLGLFLAIYLSWRRRDGTPAQDLELGLIAVTLGLEFLPLIWALAIGQTTPIILVLLAAAIVCAKRERERASGILLGLATAIKLTPALLLVYFMIRGRRGVALWGLATFAACTLFGIVVLGPAPTLRFFGSIVPAMSGGTSYFLNQSLSGFFDRLVGSDDVTQVALSRELFAKMLATACSLCLLAFTYYCVRRRPGRPAGLTFDLEVSAVMLLTLVMSPISWSHHYVISVIPLYTIAAVAIRDPRPRPMLAIAAGFALLLIARKPHHELFSEGQARLALSAALYGALILWGACLVLHSRWTDGQGTGEGVAVHAA